MPSNIEIKARVRDVPGMLRRIEALKPAGPEFLEQTDTFFRCARGRMKLRQFSDRPAELIVYLRPNTDQPKKSDYTRLPVADAAHVRSLLEQTHGLVGVVRKRRQVYLLAGVRIHLDHVQGRGDFLELEVLLDGRDEAQGVALAQGLMTDLDIQPADLVNVAYIDLLTARP